MSRRRAILLRFVLVLLLLVALRLTGASSWLFVLGFIAGVFVIYRYTGVFALWRETARKAREDAEKRSNDRGR